MMSSINESDANYEVAWTYSVNALLCNYKNKTRMNGSFQSFQLCTCSLLAIFFYHQDLGNYTSAVQQIVIFIIN